MVRIANHLSRYNVKSLMSKLAPPIETTLVLLVLLAAVYDLRYRRIPNWLVVAGLILGFALNAALFHLTGLRQAGLGSALAFAVYFPLFVLRAMGGGDVKLMLAIGALVGPLNWFILFLLAAVLGGVLAVVLLLTRGGMLQALHNIVTILTELGHFRAPYHADPALDAAHPRATTLPHAISIGLGAVTFIWLSNI